MNQSLQFEGSSIVVDQPEHWDGALAFILGHGAGQNMDSPFMSFFHSGLASHGCLSVKFNFHYMELGRRPPDRQPKLRAPYRGVIGRSHGDERGRCDQLRVRGGRRVAERLVPLRDEILNDVASVRLLAQRQRPLHRQIATYPIPE